MAVNPEDVTIYCRTLLGTGIGRCEGKIIEHGNGPVSHLEDGPFVRFLPVGKRKPRTLIDSGGNSYLLILRGVGYPDPPAPFAARPGREIASAFSAPEGDAVFDRVFAFAEPTLTGFDPRYETAFDEFISSYSERIIADYRQSETLPHSSNAERLRPRLGTNANSRGTERGDNERADSTEPDLPFDPASLQDDRRRSLALKTLRPGQAIFRERLMRAYGGRCAITGRNVPAALEAAHIIPHCGPESDHVCNGLLLRLDLHSLFNAHLLSIEPEELSLRLGDALRGGYYKIIDGRRLRLPADIASHPNRDALSKHYEQFASRQAK